MKRKGRAECEIWIGLHVYLHDCDRAPRVPWQKSVDGKCFVCKHGAASNTIPTASGSERSSNFVSSSHVSGSRRQAPMDPIDDGLDCWHLGLRDSGRVIYKEVSHRPSAADQTRQTYFRRRSDQGWLRRVAVVGCTMRRATSVSRLESACAL